MVQMLCQQTEHSFKVKALKKREIQQFIDLVLESCRSIPRVSFFLAGVQIYQPTIWVERDSYYYHRLDECISENLLFPYHKMELPCLEATSEYKASIQLVSLRSAIRGMDAAEIPWEGTGFGFPDCSPGGEGSPLLRRRAGFASRHKCCVCTYVHGSLASS